MHRAINDYLKSSLRKTILPLSRGCVGVSYAAPTCDDDDNEGDDDTVVNCRVRSDFMLYTYVW